jgi:alanyl-tRNA synthetase
VLHRAVRIRGNYLEYYRGLGFKMAPGLRLAHPRETGETLFVGSVLAGFTDEVRGRRHPYCGRIAAAQCCLRFGGKSSLYSPEEMPPAISMGTRGILFEQLGSLEFSAAARIDVGRTCRSAWGFLVDECGIEKERLTISVHPDDEDLAALWQGAIAEVAVSVTARGHRTDVGAPAVAGRATHMIFDRGREFSPHCDCEIACSCGRWIDLGDVIVFANDRGHLVATDSGMSVERLLLALDPACLYETDVAENRPLATLISPPKAGADEKMQVRVATEHSRAIAAALRHGVAPGRNRQQYVVRRMLRRAVLAVWALGFKSDKVLQLIDAADGLLATRFEWHGHSERVSPAAVRREIRLFEECVRKAAARLTGYWDGAARRYVIPDGERHALSDTFGVTGDVVDYLATHDAP